MYLLKFHEPADYKTVLVDREMKRKRRTRRVSCLDEKDGIKRGSRGLFKLLKLLRKAEV